MIAVLVTWVCWSRKTNLRFTCRNCERCSYKVEWKRCRSGTSKPGKKTPTFRSKPTLWDDDDDNSTSDRDNDDNSTSYQYSDEESIDDPATIPLFTDSEEEDDDSETKSAAELGMTAAKHANILAQEHYWLCTRFEPHTCNESRGSKKAVQSLDSESDEDEMPSNTMYTAKILAPVRTQRCTVMCCHGYVLN